MRRVLVTAIALMMTIALVPGASADSAPAVGAMDLTGEIDGAPFNIRVPEDWNGTLLVYAHGYRDKFDHPGDSTDREAEGGKDTDAAPGGDATEDALLSLGYAVAGSLYKDDGWAVRTGMVDTVALTQYFSRTVAVPDRTILWGFSMGSLVTYGLAEQNHPGFDGYIPMCAVGAGATGAWDASLTLLIAYETIFGMPADWGTAADIDNDLDFETEVFPTLFAQVSDPNNLILFDFIRSVSNLPVEDFFTGSNWLFTDMYFGTEARAELERRMGGVPMQNVGHVYDIPDADRAVYEALGVPVDDILAAMNSYDVVADRDARMKLRGAVDYRGTISKPVLSVHTRADGLVPVEHQSAYASIVAAAGNSDHLVQAYTDSVGHCTFTPEQLLTSLGAMEYWLATGSAPGSEFFPEAFGFMNDFVPEPWPYPLTK